MSQQASKIQRLEEALRQRTSEAQQLKQELERLRATGQLGGCDASSSSLSSSPLYTAPALKQDAHRRHSTPRTAATAGLTLQTNGQQQQNRKNDYHHPMKRAKTIAQPPPRTTARTSPSTMMARSSSSRSARSHPVSASTTTTTTIPFTGAGPITPPLQNGPSHAPEPVAPAGVNPVDYWQPPPAARDAMSQEMLFSQAMQQSSQQQQQQSQQSSLSTLSEQPGLDGVGMDVTSFLMSRGELDDPSSCSSSAQFSQHPQQQQQQHQQHLSPFDASMYHHQFAPATPTMASTCGSLTEAPTLATSMSRNNSNMYSDGDVSLSGQLPIDMMRIQSQSSSTQQAGAGGPGQLSRQASSGYEYVSSSSPLSKHHHHLQQQQQQHHHHQSRRSQNEQDILGVGANLPQPQPHEYASSAPSAAMLSQQSAMERSDSAASFQSDVSSSSNLLHLPGGGGAGMERSVSNTSVRSNQSLKLRAKEALARQNKNASRALLIQPRPAGGSGKDSKASNGSRNGNGNAGSAAAAAAAAAADAADAANKNGKAAISRPKYERPKHPKVKCLQCNDYPEGFRGEHELRRHTEAKHRGLVKKFVCRDPALDGIATAVQAVNPLEKCKQCNQGKQYGAYYNAAAHLRRTHFKVKPSRSRSANNNNNGSANGGGSSGSSKKNSGKDESSSAVAAAAAAAAAAQDEKRGGKGGGDWPPMNELKNWMKEILVDVGSEGALTEQCYDAEDGGDEIIDGLPVGTTTPGDGGAEGGFDMSAYAAMDASYGAVGVDPSSFEDFSHAAVATYLTCMDNGFPIGSADFCHSLGQVQQHYGVGGGSGSGGGSPHTATCSSAGTVTQQQQQHQHQQMYVAHDPAQQFVTSPATAGMVPMGYVGADEHHPELDFSMAAAFHQPQPMTSQC